MRVSRIHIAERSIRERIDVCDPELRLAHFLISIRSTRPSFISYTCWTI
jgi:hypothetical protein